MKYVKQHPKTDLNLKESLEKDGWIKIKEPKNLTLAILISFPYVLILCGVVILIGYCLKPELFSAFTDVFGVFTNDTISFTIRFDIKTVVFILCTYLYSILHEMVHGAFIPNVLTSDKIFWGINVVHGFIYTQEPIKKERFILVSCMPFIVLSLVALPVSYLFGFLNGFTFLLFLINAGGSCVDFLNIVLIFFQVKRNRSIIMNGAETYYSPE